MIYQGLYLGFWLSYFYIHRTARERERRFQNGNLELKRSFLKVKTSSNCLNKLFFFFFINRQRTPFLVKIRLALLF